MQGHVFLMNQRPHTKIQLIWKKKKETPKTSLNIRLYQALHYYYCIVINFALYVNFFHIMGLILENLY